MVEEIPEEEIMCADSTETLEANILIAQKLFPKRCWNEIPITKFMPTIAFHVYLG